MTSRDRGSRGRQKNSCLKVEKESMSVVKRALISVSDKSGVVDFAEQLVARGVEILSTGGTARLLADAGIAVKEVSEHTGFPEIMDGRVKTLHPKIHGGLLGRRGQDDAVMEEHGIAPIDLLVVNLYPFEKTVADPACDVATAIENIDIGGPTMLRSAAKNHAYVTVVVDSGDYPRVTDELARNDGAVSDATRRHLATKVFEHTARYDGAIANYLGSLDESDGDAWRLSAHRQPAVPARNRRCATGRIPTSAPPSIRGESEPAEACVGTATQLQGKELSYNNIADTGCGAGVREDLCRGSRPASSSSTPIPAAWPWARTFWPPTIAPSAPIPHRLSVASSPSTGEPWTRTPPPIFVGAPVRRGNHRADGVPTRPLERLRAKKNVRVAGMRRMGRCAPRGARLQACQRRPAGSGS